MAEPEVWQPVPYTEADWSASTASTGTAAPSREGKVTPNWEPQLSTTCS